MAAAALPFSVGALTDWDNNYEAFISPGTQRTLGGGAALLPIYGGDSNLGFSELRATFIDGSSFEYGVLLGHRLLRQDTIFGAYAAWRQRQTDRHNDFGQLGAGVEMLSPVWGLRLNYYHPIDDEIVTESADGEHYFLGYDIVQDHEVEESLRGYDIEISALLPFVENETRTYLAYYDLDADFAPEDAKGVRFGIETRPNKRVVLGLSQQEDDLYGSRFALKLRLQFGYPAERGRRDQRERMIGFVRREETLSMAPEATTPVPALEDIVHIDNTGAGAGSAPRGDGSFENPYDSFEACRQGTAGPGCTMSDSVLYVHAGDGTANGLDTSQSLDGDGADNDSPFGLADRQRLIGQGFELLGIGGDAFPQITATGADVIALARGNEIAGVALTNDSGSSGIGISGDNPGSIHIHHNRIATAGGGIRIAATDNDTVARIHDNSIDPISGTAVALSNTAAGSGSAMRAILSDNAIAGTSAGDAVSLFNRSEGGAAEQTVELAGSGVIGTQSGDGLSVLNEATAGGSADQSVDISGYTEIRGGTDGLHLVNLADDAGGTGAAATQNLVLAGGGSGTLFGNDDGLSVQQSVTGEATGGQMVSISGFAAIGTGTDKAMQIENAAEGAGAGAEQELAIVDAVEIAGHVDGVSLVNTADLGGSATQTLDLQGGGEAMITAVVDDAFQADNTALAGGAADQVLTVAGVGFDTESGTDGADLENHADGGGATATQTATFTDIGHPGGGAAINGGRDGFAAGNSAVDGSAIQQVELSGSGAIAGLGTNDPDDDGYGISLDSWANAGTAEQSIDITGFGNVTGKAAAIYLDNGAVGGGDSNQDIAITGIGSLRTTGTHADGDNGLLATNDGDRGNAVQVLDLDGRGSIVSFQGDALSLLNAAGDGGTGDQQIEIFGYDELAGGGDAIYVYNEATDTGIPGALATQAVGIDGIDNGILNGNNAGLYAEQAVDGNASADQLVEVVSYTDIVAGDRGIRAENQIAGAGADAVQEVEFFDLETVDAEIAGVWATNFAVDVNGLARQTLNLNGEDGAVISAAVDDAFHVENEAQAGATAQQHMIVTNFGFDASAGLDGVSLSNRANGAGAIADQSGTFTDIGQAGGTAVTAGANGFVTSNRAIVGFAQQELEIAGSGAITGSGTNDPNDAGYGIAAVSLADDAGTAVQNLDISGFGDVTGRSAAIYLENGAVDDGESNQDIVLTGLGNLRTTGTHPDGDDGVLTVNDGDGGTAVQILDLSGSGAITSFRGNALSLLNEAANAGIGDQQIEIFGYSELVGSRNAVYAYNEVAESGVPGALATQAIGINGVENGIIDGNNSGLYAEQVADGNASAEQLVEVVGFSDIVAGDRGIRAENEIAGEGADAVQEVEFFDLEAIDAGVAGVWATNLAVDVNGLARQTLNLNGEDGAVISAAIDDAFHVENEAQAGATAQQHIIATNFGFDAASGNDGVDLDNLANGAGAVADQTGTFTNIGEPGGTAVTAGASGFVATNDAIEGTASQDFEISGAGAVIGAGDYGMYLESTARAGGAADQAIAVSGFEDAAGSVAAIRVHNTAADAGSVSEQNADLSDLQVSDAPADGIVFSNAGENGGEGIQAVTLTDSTVENATGIGLLIENDINETLANAIADQTVDLSAGGNAVSGSAGAADIDILNDAGTGDSQLVDLTNNPDIAADSNVQADGQGNQTVVGP